MTLLTTAVMESPSFCAFEEAKQSNAPSLFYGRLDVKNRTAINLPFVRLRKRNNQTHKQLAAPFTGLMFGTPPIL